MEEDTANFEYRPGVKDKVNELESRLSSKSNEVEYEKSRITRQSSGEIKIDTGTFAETVSNLEPPIRSAPNSNLLDIRVRRTTSLSSPEPEPQNIIKSQPQEPAGNGKRTNDSGTVSQLNKYFNVKARSLDMQDRSSTKSETRNIEPAPPPVVNNNEAVLPAPVISKIPVPAPRRQLLVQKPPVIGRNKAQNDHSTRISPPPPGSGSSTRRSSEDDGIADMASESDPFDDSSMPLPKIKENAFLVKDRRQTNASGEGDSEVAASPKSPMLLLRRGSLNPQQLTIDDHKERPKPSRTRTDSTNSAENFVVRQISSGHDTNRRESQAEITIDVLQSKGAQQTDTGMRSPVVVKSKTLSNSTASILVIGLPQSGKSKTIDSLVHRPVTSVDGPTPTNEIIEYTAKIKILDSPTLFSLKIIDTPGYTNDPTIASDSQLMTTLISYLDSKEGLRGKSPTIILVVFRFDDQRLWNPEDEHPDIVNFLKLIHNFQQHLSDGKNANFVFVLTHIMSGNTTAEEKRRPQSKIVELINIIQKYTSLPLPIMVVCAENERKMSSSENTNSSIIASLPNGEAYPYNLIEKIKVLLTKKGRDSVGETVLRTAFGIEYPYSIKECEVTQRIPLISTRHLSVQQMKKAILHAYKDIERTEIFTLLEIGWENIDIKIRDSFSESLFTVQQIFQTKKVCNFVDIPEDPVKILQLVRQMPSNLAVKDLLIDTLQLKVPACYPALYVGQGFDLGKDMSTNVSPFQFSTGLKTSPVGLIPNEMQCKIRDDREICFKFFHEVEDYVVERLKDVNLRYFISQNSLPAFSAAASVGHRWGYNLIRNQEPTKSTIGTAIIEYRTFQMKLEPHPDLIFKSQFWEAVQNIPDLDIKDPSSVTAWRKFFGYWGTHVVKSAFGGGSVEITFKGSLLSKIYNSMKKDFILPSDEYETSKVFQWITGDGLDFVAACGKDVKSDFLQGYDIEAHFHGGDLKYQQVDLTKLESREEVANIREDWKESLALNPVMLETNLVLVPLSYYVRPKAEGIATKIDVALHYFYSNFMVSQGKQSSCSIL